MLGQKVKCRITGVTGIAIAKIEFMNSCVQYQIQPKKIVDGVPVEAKWYDVEQVALVEPKKARKRDGNGGPPPSTTPKRCRRIV